jgi:transposase
VEFVPWAFPEARFTKAFDYSVVDLVQVADKTAASRIFRTAWRTVGRMVERVVAKELPVDRFADLTEIGVDETSYKRGHRYLTAVVNLATGRVIWLGEGKSAETLGSFFQELGPDRCKKLELISMDMSGAFKKAIEEHAPHVAIAYDKFHVVKLLLEAIDEVRREEVRAVEGVEARKALKGTRFALLRNPKHRKPKDHDAIKLVQRTNRRLARAYQLRVDIEGLWEIEDPEEARAFLMRWTRSALLSRLDPLRRFARTVRDHLDGILGYFHWGRTNAKLEGTNNKIKLAIHRAFGFHSVSSLMAMVYLCCGGLDLSEGLGI